ncbi:HGWP repeat containing protein-like [Oryza sativa Japonica Group]|uniref:cysteine dioxygenase n=1 Tax=Oryza sativa subsp. japonica TaxID=39947 RepID=Q5ZDH3_ORYSJ|nr:HGWP repeat containing protein-like [Oryza sativa Japonica Group]
MVGWSHHRCWASTSSPPACLRRRRLVPPSTRLAYYAAVVGRLYLHRRPASVAADWCLRLYGWLVTPPLLGVYIFTAGLPPSPPTGVFAYMVGWSHHRCWAFTSSPPACLRRRRVVPPPTRLAYYAAVVGRLRLHRRPASVAADWCLRLHGWPIMPPLLGVYDFTAGLPPSPPSDASAYTAGLLCRRCWASTTSPPACLRRRRLVPPPTRLAYYAAAVGRLRLHRRPASVAADWCLRLHGWPIMPPLLGVYDFTAGLPPSPPSGASAYMAGLLCRRCWASTTSPPARLRRRRVVPPPTWLAYYAAAVGRLRRHRRPASVAAEWCLRLHGWPIMPPLLGVYDLTAGPPPSPPTGVLAYTIQICIKGIHGFKLISYAPGMDQSEHHHRLASTAADWCFRLHGWPIMPPLLGVYVFTDRLAFAAADWCFRLHGWPLCRRCWASTSSPTGRLDRRRLVFPPERLAFMPPLLGVYVFTDRPPRPPPTGVSACTAGLLCRRCWASTSSPTGRLDRRRLVFPPERLAFMPPLLGVYVFTDRPPRPPPTGVSACTAGLLCRRCWASTSSPTGLPSPLPTGVSACTAGLYAAVVGRLRLHRPAASTAADWCFRLHGWPLCRRCWASTSSPTGCLVCRRLVLPPARLTYYAAVVGRLRLHRPAASTAADWCFRLHGWPIMPPLLGVYVFTDRLAFVAADRCPRLHGWPLCRRCWASTSSPTGLPSPPPTGVSACTAGLYAAVVGRLRLHRPACLRRRRLLGVYVFTDRLAFVAADWCPRLHGWPIMPPLLGAYVFTDRLAFVAADRCPRLHGWPLCRRCWASTSSPTGLPSPPPTGVSTCTAGLYAAVVGRLRLHRPAAASAADWCHRLHGWPVITPTDAIFFTAGYIAVTTNRHQYLQHKLPTFAMTADWFLHFHGCMILPVLIGLTIFIAGRLVCC